MTKFNVGIQRPRYDYALIQVEAESEAEAIAKAQDVLGGGFCPDDWDTGDTPGDWEATDAVWESETPESKLTAELGFGTITEARPMTWLELSATLVRGQTVTFTQNWDILHHCTIPVGTKATVMENNLYEHRSLILRPHDDVLRQALSDWDWNIYMVPADMDEISPLELV